MDRKAIRRALRDARKYLEARMYLQVDGNDATLQIVCKVKAQDSFDDGERRQTFPVKATVRPGYFSSAAVDRDGEYGKLSNYEGPRDFNPTKGFWPLGYSADLLKMSDLLKIAPDTARFSVYLDGHSNGYAAKNRVHCDVLELIWTDRQGEHVHDIDSSVGEHNSARFGVYG